MPIVAQVLPPLTSEGQQGACAHRAAASPPLPGATMETETLRGFSTGRQKRNGNKGKKVGTACERKLRKKFMFSHDTIIFKERQRRNGFFLLEDNDNNS